MEGNLSATYSESQIHLLLNDLKNNSHTVRLKAIKRFQEYIKLQPEIYDDSVDFLLTGKYQTSNNGDGQGLIHFCGLLSSSHDGYLKRICKPAIGLLRFLVELETGGDEENIFFERFVQLPKEELAKINFAKHILSDDQKGLFSSNERGGSPDDALELLSIIFSFHRTADGEEDKIDLSFFLEDNKILRDKFAAWLQKNATEQARTAALKLKEGARLRETRGRQARIRPATWAEVVFETVPMQEGEGITTAASEEDKADISVPDPFGLVDIDLRSAQAVHLSEEEHIYSPPSPSTPVVEKAKAKGVRGGIFSRRKKRRSSLDHLKIVQNLFSNTSKMNSNTSAVAESDDEDGKRQSSPKSERETVAVNSNLPDMVASVRMSVIPFDKNFSARLFLQLIHAETSFNQLSVGLEHLNNHLAKQSDQRQALVRQNFGLFVQCAEGLDWLKEFRRGMQKKEMPSAQLSNEGKNKGGDLLPKIIFVETGDVKLQRAHEALNKAKSVAQRTLAPILERMTKLKKLTNTDEIVKFWSGALMVPANMAKCLEAKDYESVLMQYRKINAMLPSVTKMPMLLRVKDKVSATVGDFRKCIIRELMLDTTVEPDYVVRLLKYISEIDDEKTARDVLRQTCNEKLKCCASQIFGVYGKFKLEAAQAFLKGQEMNVMKDKSSNTGSPSRSRPFSFKEKAGISVLNGSIGPLKSLRTIFPTGQKHRVLTPKQLASLDIYDNDQWFSFMSSDNSDQYANADQQEEDETNFDGSEDFFGESSDDDSSGQSISDEEVSSDDFGESASSDFDEIHSVSDDMQSLGISSANKIGKIKRKSTRRKNGRLAEEDVSGFMRGQLHNSVSSEDFCEIYCSRVRILFILRVFQVLDSWYPSLQMYAQLLSCFDPFGFNASVIEGNNVGMKSNPKSSLTSLFKGQEASSGSNDTLSSIVLARQKAQYVREGLNFSKQICNCFVNALEAIQQILNGINVESVPEESKLKSPPAEEVSAGRPVSVKFDSSSQSTAGDKIPIISIFGDLLSKNGGQSLKGILGNKYFAEPLRGLLYSKSLQDISDFHESVELLLDIANPYPTVCSVNSCLNSSSWDYKSVTKTFEQFAVILKNLSETGEDEKSKLVLRELSASNNILLTNWQNQHSARFSDDVMTANKIKKSKKYLTLERLMKSLETQMVFGVRRLSQECRKPLWISSKVRSGIVELFRAFLGDMKTKVLNSFAFTEKNKIEGNDQLDELEFKLKVEGIRSTMFQVTGLYLEANSTQRFGPLTRSECLLDLIRACELLRTNVISKVWHEVSHKFPSVPLVESESSTGDIPVTAPESPDSPKILRSPGFGLGKMLKMKGKKDETAGKDVMKDKKDEVAGVKSDSGWGALRKRIVASEFMDAYNWYECFSTSSESKTFDMTSSDVGDKLKNRLHEGIKKQTVSVYISTHKSDFSATGGIVNCLSDGITVEVTALARYLHFVGTSLKETLYAGFNIYAKMEDSSHMNASFSGSAAVPNIDFFGELSPHFSKILLILGRERRLLKSTLSNVPLSIPKLTFGSKNDSYENFMFRDLITGVLSMYYMLIQSLLTNSFTITEGSNRMPSKVSYAASELSFPRCAALAIDEFEFLKVSLQDCLLPNVVENLPVFNPIISTAGTPLSGGVDKLKRQTKSLVIPLIMK